MKKAYLIIFALIALFLVTRLYKITEIPGSLYWDEASIGYNAYSILQTGRDEWGDLLPLHFRAFGEFKLPVYIYSVVITGKILGVNDLAVRIPSVIFSLGIMILTILLAKKLTGQQGIGFLSAFILTTSPWFFIFSRTGFEVTAGLMFFLLGIHLYLLADKKPYMVIISILSFILSIYSYNGFRILVPLTLVFLFFYQSKKSVIWCLLSYLIFAISTIPLIRLVILDNGASRFQAVGILNQTDSIQELATAFIGNYLSHFNPLFLFISGDSNVRLHSPGFGQLFVVAIPFILLGLWWIFRNYNKQLLFLIFLLGIAPIPAAITFEVPHALRAFTMVPLLSIIMACGASELVRIAKTNLINILVVVVFLSFFGAYYLRFITTYNFLSSADWQYPYHQIFTKKDVMFNAYDRVIISDSYAQPYIFALYYLKYNPKLFLATVTYNPVDKFGFSTVKSFNRFIFESVTENKLPSGRLLIFSAPKEKFNNGTFLGKIENIDGNTAFDIYEYIKQ